MCSSTHHPCFQELIIPRQNTDAYGLQTTIFWSFSPPNHHICPSNTQLSIAEINTKIAAAVDKSLSKRQKALFLRPKLAAINAEVQRLEVGNSDLHGTGNAVEEEDELGALSRRINALPTSTEARHIAATDNSNELLNRARSMVL